MLSHSCQTVFCLTFCEQQVGDVGPILDLMAVVLENIPTCSIIAKATISAVHQTARLISSLPNLSYHKKVSVVLKN